jgi:hypothetical protein
VNYQNPLLPGKTLLLKLQQVGTIQAMKRPEGKRASWPGLEMPEWLDLI